MLHKYCCLLFISLYVSFFLTPAFGQLGQHWQELKQLTIYALPAGTKVDKLTIAEAEKLPSVEADVMTARKLLERSSFEGDQQYIWKGERLAIVGFSDGHKLKLKISRHGRFLYDYDRKGIVQFKSDADKEAWEDFISKYAAVLEQKE